MLVEAKKETGPASMEPFRGKPAAPPVRLSGNLVYDREGNCSVSMEASFLVGFIRQSDGGFVAYIPAMPAASTQGESFEEAVAMVKESILGMLAVSGFNEILAPDQQEYFDCIYLPVSVPLNEAA